VPVRMSSSQSRPSGPTILGVRRIPVDDRSPVLRDRLSRAEGCLARSNEFRGPSAGDLGCDKTPGCSTNRGK